jgi:hypothetical protein
MSTNMTMAEFAAAQKEFVAQLEIPYPIWAALGGKGYPTMFGDQIQLTKDGDFISVEQAREVVKWLAHQLGMEAVVKKET